MLQDRSTGGSFVYQSKADAVYTEVRRRIVAGVLAPSASLNQEQLAAELGVSTTPLREALRRLESEGFIRTVTHREMVVAPLDVDELVALSEVRENLDAQAAALAAERHTPEDRERILAAIELLRHGQPEEALTINRQFHAVLYRSCHNPVLIRLLDSLWDHADRYRRLVGFLASDAHVLQEHEALVGAILERRADEAAKLMRDHLRAARELMVRKLEGGERDDRDRAAR